VVEAEEVKEISLRHVWEPQIGQCHARNRGLHEAVGDVILYTDDDVRVPADWIERMSRPIVSGECDAIQGGVRMAEGLSRPWMTALHKSCLAEKGGFWEDAPPGLVGANMAFHRRVLEEIPGFDTLLGPGALGFGDDSLFAKQVITAGFTIQKQLDVVAEHHFDGTRLGREHWLSIARKMGQSWGYVAHHWEHNSADGCWFRVAKRMGRLMQKRAMRWKDWHQEEGISEWELIDLADLHQNLWRWRHRNDPRRYDRHGLKLRDEFAGRELASV
jgi:glycosyltransferase involved in cell wall biosynthesis